MSVAASLQPGRNRRVVKKYPGRVWSAGGAGEPAGVDSTVTERQELIEILRLRILRKTQKRRSRQKRRLQLHGVTCCRAIKSRRGLHAFVDRAVLCRKINTRHAVTMLRPSNSLGKIASS